MSSQNNKIQFLLRMDRANALLQALAAFLVAEKITTQAEISELQRKPVEAQAQNYYLMLASEKLFLVDWEWTILPTEHMKLTLITHNGVKEFTYEQ